MNKTLPPQMKPYSVLLAYPSQPYSDIETYFAHVNAPDPDRAVVIAQRKAAKNNFRTSPEGREESMHPWEFEPLLCLEGHHVDCEAETLGE